ncbi:MAG TPA: hypothetical protein VNW30_08090 [Opitutaceae bacterium]|jgi:hypothetical protein|nr:hypothetical protein [Opitutaceae bacterium]
MSSPTLKEALQQYRAAHPPSLESYNRAHELVRMVQIHLWNGEQWVLPWAHLVSACHQGTGESEQLVLMFAHHEVVLHGANLALLLSEIASFHVDCLREIPENFRAQICKDEPFISRISVRPLTNSGKAEQLNSPQKEGGKSGLAGVQKNTIASVLRLDFPELRPDEQHKKGQTCSLG